MHSGSPHETPSSKHPHPHSTSTSSSRHSFHRKLVCHRRMEL
ncbi:predicted protein [Plenodomus lingam JN3]|uniref:Uncharacterized protein n=1 Tax=Leptosphaeria maculans (strain JN3 / isolate v23.1.3 / race Av1-4-5-6-7-8) TaxID=985895 RepID=E5A7V4_LEPMJ|nr:predicted protein [Plenodomus lingam JN3]CBX99699.1 predicted protein [Plenodomus lingam JN3]